MTARYRIRIVKAGTEIYDATTGDDKTGIKKYGPCSYDEAKRKVAEMNKPAPEQQPAAPCCDYHAALEHLIDGIEVIAPSLMADQREVLLHAINQTRALIKGEG
jgi:hypothetical protein